MDQLRVLAPMLIVVPLLVFWFWMFREMLRNDRLPDNVRLMWLAGFLFLNVFAAAYYYLTEYKDRR